MMKLTFRQFIVFSIIHQITASTVLLLAIDVQVQDTLINNFHHTKYINSTCSDKNDPFRVLKIKPSELFDSPISTTVTIVQPKNVIISAQILDAPDAKISNPGNIRYHWEQQSFHCEVDQYLQVQFLTTDNLVLSIVIGYESDASPINMVLENHYVCDTTLGFPIRKTPTNYVRPTISIDGFEGNNFVQVNEVNDVSEKFYPHHQLGVFSDVESEFTFSQTQISSAKSKFVLKKATGIAKTREPKLVQGDESIDIHNQRATCVLTCPAAVTVGKKVELSPPLIEHCPGNERCKQSGSAVRLSALVCRYSFSCD